jgi:hypothetical protein
MQIRHKKKTRELFMIKILEIINNFEEEGFLHNSMSKNFETQFRDGKIMRNLITRELSKQSGVKTILCDF